jgi:hypothetical protein
MKNNELYEIHNSLLNGNRSQMVEQIDEYGLYDFWDDFKYYLAEHHNTSDQKDIFQDATISYFRIKNR